MGRLPLVCTPGKLHNPPIRFPPLEFTMTPNAGNPTHDGSGPVLRSDLPDSTSYAGRNGIVLDLPEHTFQPPSPDDPTRMPIERVQALSPEQILEALRNGDESIFPSVARPSASAGALFSAQDAHINQVVDIATASFVSKGLFSQAVHPDLQAVVNPADDQDQNGNRSDPVPESRALVAEARPASLPPAVRGTAFSRHALAEWATRPTITELDPRHVIEQIQHGRRINVYRRMSGDYTYRFQPEPAHVHPQLVLIETYRLSSFLGAYGAGRTLKTFSLFPGERTTISVKTFRNTESETKAASSILDSFSQESADDFETSVLQENSSKSASEESFEYHAEAEASASWGFGSASVSGGTKGGTAAQREEFSKNVTNALRKHSSKASSKREMEVNTSTAVRASAGEETSIEREIENINVSRTLNFIFRQMNQEHISLLHLVDVRVAYWEGRAESVHEVPLSKLDELLELHVRPEKQAATRELILDQIRTVFDYQDQLVDPPLVEERVIDDHDSFLRFRKDATSTYTDETGNSITVPGAIVAATKNVMRTEGIVVDALLGQGEALDTYSRGLQETSVHERELDNAAQQARLDREALARDIVTREDEDAAQVYRELFPTAVQLPGTISVSAGDGIDVSLPGNGHAAASSLTGQG